MSPDEVSKDNLQKVTASTSPVKTCILLCGELSGYQRRENLGQNMYLSFFCEDMREGQQ